MSRLRAGFLFCALAWLPCSTVGAQTFLLSSADLADSAAMARTAPRLAAQVLAAYQDSNRARFLDNTFRLQMLTGKHADAAASLKQLRALTKDGGVPARAARVQYEILAQARVREGSGRAFADVFAQAFREQFGRLDDRTASFAARAILLSPRTVANDLRWATPNLRDDGTTVSLDEALTFLHVYQAVESYRAFAGLPPALVAEDDARRFVVAKDVPVPGADGAMLCAVVARPRKAAGKLPTLLQFTIYADSVTSVRDAFMNAAHGYAGVIGFTRGKACSPDRTVPYVHDGADAAAMINWIAVQPWSDGTVGMYGGSYSGFTAWAAAKHAPRALRAIMVGAPAAPGIDVPMEGNVFWNFVYAWPLYTTNNRWLDNATYSDIARWNGLSREWYASGRPYRDLPAIDGTPNPIFAEWIAHPSIDAYWRAMLPQEGEYEKIQVPILQTAGYFYGGPGAAAYYYAEHTKHNPRANHYLLIGPYDHSQAQRGVVTPLSDTATYFSGYEIDPVARIDITADLRFPWFDYAMRGKPKPALLRDRVNYQVMGANRWGHAPSVAAMADSRLRLYFSAARSGEHYTLRGTPGDSGITHTVNLADRADTNQRWIGGLLAREIDTNNAVTLASEPFAEAMEVSGLMTGHLELIANKRDFDFSITPYELTSGGDYYQLPPYTSRASFVGSLQERRLLTPGSVQRLDFVSSLRMMSRRIGAGSRLVLVLKVVKGEGQQINYGTGGDVSSESIADAGEPLAIRWLGSSYVEFPTRR